MPGDMETWTEAECSGAHEILYVLRQTMAVGWCHPCRLEAELLQ